MPVKPSPGQRGRALRRDGGPGQEPAPRRCLARDGAGDRTRERGAARTAQRRRWRTRPRPPRRGFVPEAARSPERVFLPGRKDPVVLRQNSAELFLLARLRDEAHRFAITFHRKLRRERNFQSVLEEIPGIGEGRKKALLRHFGSLKRVREALARGARRGGGVRREAGPGGARLLPPGCGGRAAQPERRVAEAEEVPVTATEDGDRRGPGGRAGCLSLAEVGLRRRSSTLMYARPRGDRAAKVAPRDGLRMGGSPARSRQPGGAHAAGRAGPAGGGRGSAGAGGGRAVPARRTRPSPPTAG